MDWALNEFINILSDRVDEIQSKFGTL